MRGEAKRLEKEHTGRRNISKKQCVGRQNGSKNGAESEKWKKILKKFRKWYRMYNFCIVVFDKIQYVVTIHAASASPEQMMAGHMSSF